jgi:hypothetical protein
VIGTIATEYPTDQGLGLKLALKRTKTRENGTIWIFFFLSNHSTARFIATHCSLYFIVKSFAPLSPVI